MLSFVGQLRVFRDALRRSIGVNFAASVMPADRAVINACRCVACPEEPGIMGVTIIR